MESIDNRKVRRVWDRVQGTGETGADAAALTALLCQERTDAAVFIQLARRLGGRGGPLLELSRQCQQNAGCLRGICTIMTGTPPEIAVPSPAEEPAQSALRKCYVNLLGRMRAYELRSQDPNYGPVFRKMAAAAENSCAAVLELLGKLS